MSFPLDNLSSLYLDILKEIGTIGAGNAATSFSKLLNRRIDMNVPEVKIAEFRDVEEMMGGAETPVVGIYLEFNGDISGTVLVILDCVSAKHITSLLLGDAPVAQKEFSEIEISALEEIGNILTAAYLGAISSFTGLTMKPSVPSFAYDMLGAILSVPMIQFGQSSDKAMFIETDLINGTERFRSHFIVIPDIESFPVILKALGVV
ncbi:chemotaxis protein CheC [Caldicoprobacter guelmensis]|uniref:chemotaxis protein CheC n=1 Tax=Caldicoprobacter guelmensis TaxID=1170224 RepID=UPI001958A705|nr:chemotaxis protein CheC [Caldicoprobacter guelmensis]MBM7581404.1 chemotaxis protein CheC [Caldicoprobacter guelmensis]